MSRRLLGQLGDDLKALRETMGKELKGLARDQYRLNGEIGLKDEGSLELGFTDGSVLLLETALGGDSVTASAQELDVPEGFEIGEGEHCSFDRVNLLLAEPWSRLRGARLVGAEAAIDRDGGQPMVIGWILRFDSGDLASYINAGDSSRIRFNAVAFQLKEGVDVEQVASFGSA